ncbi:MAG: hypothetical protein ACXWYT_10790 [Actinomycetota bacterium]
MPTMRTCPSCGAHVADDLEWCNQCYSALPAVPAPAATVEVEVPAEAERPLWVRSNIGQPDVKIAPEFSRWRGGATSFGPFGRVLLTLGVLMMLIVGYPLLRGLIYTVIGMDVPGAGLVVLYTCAALPAGAYLLSRVWKRERIN